MEIVRVVLVLAFLFLSSVTMADTVRFSSFFGSTAGENTYDICTDIHGNFCISGRTYGTGTPLLNAADSSFGGVFDAFVAKFDSDGQTLFSTYLGGSGQDLGYSIASDPFGNFFVCGTTNSSDFFLSVDADDSVIESEEGFIVKYSPTGEVLYSSYFGAGGVDGITDVATDSEGNVYVVGNAESGLTPTGGAFQSTYGGSTDGFIVKLNNDCTSILYCTYFGGSAIDAINHVAVDQQGNILIGGTTASASSSFPLRNALDASLGASEDAFIAKFSPSFDLEYSTYLGGSATGATEHDDALGALSVDNYGRAHVVGNTRCTDFPLEEALDSSFTGTMKGYITILESDGSDIVFSTYWGGNSDYDNLTDVEVRGDGGFYVCGMTKSTDYRLLCPWDSVYDEGIYPYEGFLTRFDASGAGVEMSTYIGGSSADAMNGCALFGSRVYLGGTSSSHDFPVEHANDPTCGDGIAFQDNAVILIIDECPDDDCDWDCNAEDNCPITFNPDQDSTDSDAFGDACDPCSVRGGDLCCCGLYTDSLTGNANCSPDGKITLSDITALIDHVYISKDPLCCMAAGNVNGSEDCKVTLSDITGAIDHVYITKLQTALCMPECEPYPYE